MNSAVQRQRRTAARWIAAAVWGVTGAAFGAVQLGESMDSGLENSYTTGEVTLTSGVWNVVSVYQEAAEASYGGAGAAARLNDDTPGASLGTPALATAGTITFWYRELNSGGGDFILQKSYDASVWVDVATQAFSGTTFVLYSNDVNDAASPVYLRVLNDGQAGHLIVDEFEITTYEAGPTAPVFGANPGPVGATAEVAVAFTVTVGGQPEPVLALESTTAAAGSYLFEAETGHCVYEPPEGDVGEQAFVFAASNTLGAAMQTVTVNVAPAPVLIPTVTVTNPGTESLTVQWTEVTDAASYQVQVATDTNFTAGSGGGGLFISEVADPGDDANARFVELYNGSGAAIDFGADSWYLSRQANGGTWGTVGLTGTLAAGGTYVVANNAAGYEGAFGDTADLYDAVISGNGDDGYFLYSGGDHASGTLADAYGVVDQDGTGMDWEYTDSHAERNPAVTGPTSVWTLTEWTITGANAAGTTPHAHTATGGSGGEGGMLVADLTVGGRSVLVTNLEMETTYFIRVRAAPTGTWSGVVLATTLAGAPAAPQFTGGAGPYGVTAGGLLDFTVSAMGTPAPALALEGATAATNDYAFEASTGYFLYAPPLSDGGTAQAFTFTASNTEGVATQVVTVNVAAASAPVFGANPGPLTATAGVARTFTVSATGAPEPVLALESSTASAGTYSFTPGTGQLGYTPSTNDLGGQMFTFTASNLVGVATQAVQVAVTNAPGLPTIDALSALQIEAGQTATVWVVAREADGDSLTLTASNLPENATFPAANGTIAVSNLFTFTPGTNQAGQAYEVAFHASDVHGTATGTLNIAVASDDPWADYYASCYSNGVLKTGDELKGALHDIIDDHAVKKYATYGATILSEIDECPTNSTMVQCLYLQHGIDKNSRGSVSGTWNNEHVWANSHGITDNDPAYSDWHHLHATDAGANSDRSSRDFDVVTGTTTNYSFSGTITAGLFEPPIAGKGDVARALFYMAVRYNGEGDLGFSSDLELTNAAPVSGAWHGKLETLLEWNELDPVNDYERRRNNLVYTNWQGNRNPFVDHPEWARAVFDTNYLTLPALTAFAAEANGSDRIDVSFAYSGTGDGVVIVWDVDGTFETPSGMAPAVGQAFAGGTVLYKGASSPQSHTGLTGCQDVHYKCWTVAGTNYAASGLTAEATTAGADAPASVWAGVTNATEFTVVWSGVGGVTEYVLDVATGAGFTGSGGGWSTIFRETMGESAGTILLAEHEAADGFDHDELTMTDGGAENPADIRSSSGSAGYVDPAGNLASSNANVYFTATGVTNLGFAIEGIDTRGYEALAVSFGYRKEDAAANMALGVEWSVDGGGTWNAVAVSNLPVEGAAAGWYMVSNLAVSLAALDATNMSLRWTKSGGVAGRIDDVLLQGRRTESLFVAGYSNRVVSGATSAAVTGLTAGATYYFRVGSLPHCGGPYTAEESVTTLEVLSAPEFGGATGPYSTTVDVAVAFTVSATGSPAPALALAGTDAQAGSYDFEAGTGQMSYTPVLAEIGERTFTFTASNTQGVATQVVTVTVEAGVPLAPAVVWAAETNVTSFTAEWTPVGLATGYRLDVSTEADFYVAGGESVQTVLASNAATSAALITNGWEGTDLGGDSYVILTQATAAVVTPVFSTVEQIHLAVDFEARTYGGTGCSNITVSVSTNGGVEWTVLGVVNPSNGSTWVQMPSVEASAGLGQEQTRIRWQALDAGAGVGVGIRSLRVQGEREGSEPFYAAGYSNRAVSGTSESVTGLAEDTTYFFRVRAVNAAGTSTNSATASVTTMDSGAAPQTITFPAIATQIESNVLELFATASSGLPVSFAVSAGPAQIDGGTTLSFTGTGTVSVVALQTGDGSWQAAPEVTHTFNVLAATLTNQFLVWVEVDQEQEPEDEDFAWDADMDGDGMSTWEEFLANTDPADPDSILFVEGDSVQGSVSDEVRFTFPASSDRFYQLVYSTSLFSSATVTNLGWGTPGGVMAFTNEIPGLWYGRIRVRLTEPD